jgi:glucosyl-dolichyl phosphate glucuronosyltransferase
VPVLSPPKISVIVATHNRADLLGIALESLARQTVSGTEFEVIVVDNASSDHTAAVVQNMTAEIPRLEYVLEARLGLSWARNAGLAGAKAPYVAYLDDDARAEPGWVEALLAAFARTTPAPLCVGGPVYLNWGGLPKNVPPRYWSLLTYLNYGAEDRPLAEAEYLVGANMAFDRQALLAAGGFSTQLGRQGAKLLSGEEAQAVSRIRQSGGEVHYAAKAAVFHAVQPDRVRPSWLWRRIFWDGASQPVLDGAARHNRSYCALQAYRDVKRIVLFLLRSLAAFCGRDQARSFDFALNATQRAGRLRTHLLLLLGWQS